MARARDPNRNKAFEIYKEHNGSIDLVEIASQLDVPPGTVRRWKSTYHWDGEHQSERSEKKSERSENKKSEAKRDALYAQLEKEEIEKNNSSEGSDPTTWTCLETSPSVGGGVS